MAAAEGYERHVGRYGAELASGMVRAAGVGPGSRVLDVGCGTGALLAAAAAVAGAGRCAGVDPSEPFAAAAARRASGADVRVAPAEALPFADGSFDAVLAQLVVNLLPDPVAGLREMRRVARPGAAVAACVWSAGEMPVLDAFWAAAAEVAPAATSAVAGPERVGYASGDELTAHFERAGLGGCELVRLTATARYGGFEDLWWPYARGVGRSGSLCAGLAEGDRGRLRERMRELLGAPDGPLELTAVAWCAVAGG